MSLIAPISIVETLIAARTRRPSSRRRCCISSTTPRAGGWNQAADVVALVRIVASAVAGDVPAPPRAGVHGVRRRRPRHAEPAAYHFDRIVPDFGRLSPVKAWFGACSACAAGRNSPRARQARGGRRRRRAVAPRVSATHSDLGDLRRCRPICRERLLVDVRQERRPRWRSSCW